MKDGRRTFLRDLEAGSLLDVMLLTAVLSVLAIRFYLHLTGYPTVGGDTLHIAHMLWGGLMMMAAMVLLVVFLDRRSHQLAAVLGGSGFGVFIDEVGKFITHDNDYFYQPAVSVMYVVFLLLYFGGRTLTRRGRASRAEYLVNALRETGEIAVGDLDRRERDRALGYLEASGDSSTLAEGLKNLFRDADLVDEPRDGLLKRIMRRSVEGYRRLAGQAWFGWALIALFSAKFLGTILRLTEVTRLLAPGRADLFHIPLVTTLPGDPAEFATAQWLQLAGSLLSGVFVAWGIILVFRDRKAALRRFSQSVVVTLCVTQVFVFYRVEWLGIGELVFNLLILAGLQFAISREAGGDTDQGRSRG